MSQPVEADGRGKLSAREERRRERREKRDAMILKPAWRTRTTRDKRLVASLATVIPLTVIGFVLLMLFIGGLAGTGAPMWFATLPWTLLSALALFLAVRTNEGANPERDDIDWTAWAIQRVICGEGKVYPLVVRLVLASLFGAPLLAMAIVLAVLELFGAF